RLAELIGETSQGQEVVVAAAEVSAVDGDARIGCAHITGLEAEGEGVGDLIACTDKRIPGELGATKRGVAVDEGDTNASPDIGSDHRSWHKVIREVGQCRELTSLVGQSGAGNVDVRRALTVADIEVDSGTDEVVSELAANHPADTCRIVGRAQWRCNASAGADIEARLRVDFLGI